MDHKYYGGSRLKLLIGRKAEQIAGAWEDWLIEALESYPEFVPPISFEKIKALADRVIDRGVKMGEGWLLPGEAAELMKLTAPDLLELGVIDGIIPEPEGGAHLAPAAHMRQVDRALSRCLAELSKESGAALAAGRYQKFRRMGAAPQKEEA